VEDQQSAAGDLTGAEDEAAAEESAAARRRHRMPIGKARRQADPPSVTDESTDPTEIASAPPDVEAGGQVVFVERKPAGRRAAIVITVAAALFVGGGIFAGATLQPYLADRAAVETKLDIARTAADAITTLWTYTPDNMESLADRSAKFLGGDFQAQYRKYVDAIVPTNKQAQVTNSTEVVGAAVESLPGPDSTEATAIVYTNSTATSPLTKNIPSMRYLSYRLTLTRDHANWLVTKMSTITSLDLTPQL
jgi:Mce-associated membrane protein